MLNKKDIKYIKDISKVLFFFKFLFGFGGAGCIAVGQLFISNNSRPFGDFVFWLGFVILIVSGVVVLFIDRDPAYYIHRYNKQKKYIRYAESYIKFIERRAVILNSKNLVNNFMQEIADEAFLIECPDNINRDKLLNKIVEFISTQKKSLFNIEDEYCNISIHIHDKTRNDLYCAACYRSVPSDAVKIHRRWPVGRGHIGKTFELKDAFVCADANIPEVRRWFSVPSEDEISSDLKKYVSLAAFPFGLNRDDPLGVFIVTSSVRRRFVDLDDEALSEEEGSERQLAIAALQEFAAHIAHIVAIFELRALLARTGGSRCLQKRTLNRSLLSRLVGLIVK